MKYVSNRKQFIKNVEVKVNAVGYELARRAVNKMRQGMKRDSQARAVLKIRKSKFKTGRKSRPLYLMGVFDNRGGKWTDSLAARAIYQSYGHAKPYQGRGYVNRRFIVKHVKGNEFIQRALRSMRREIPRYMKGALK